MGLFNKVSKISESSDGLSEREAMLAILFLATVEDGHISDEEASSFKHIAIRLGLFNKDDQASVQKLLNKLFNLYESVAGPAMVNRAAAVLSPKAAETAFALATDRIVINGKFTDGEEAFLEVLKMSLNISEELADKIIEVCVIKNRIP